MGIEEKPEGPTKEHTDIMAPIDKPNIDLGTLLSVATLIIVNIKKKLINTSKPMH